MRYILYSLFTFALFVNLWAGDYEMVRVSIGSKSDLERLAGLGIDFEGSRFKQNQFIDLQISSAEKESLRRGGFSFNVLIDDLEYFYASRLETQFGEGFGYGSMGGYYTFDEVMSNLDSMISSYPNLISGKDTIGYSNLGRPIVAVKISDNPQLTENEPEVFLTGLHHAREPAGMMSVLYYMWYLLENYNIDIKATYLVNYREMWFVPVVNPDGYIHNQQTYPNGGGMWRLNARDNNSNGIFFQSGIDGVDLNRNYGYQWGYDNIGSSPTPGSSTFRGPSPFSELETSIIRDFCNLHQFQSAFNYHTYSNLLIHPWAYNDSPTPDHLFFHTFGVDMTRFNGYTLGTPGQTVGYAVNGDSNDWMYGEQASKPKIFAFTPEVGNSSDGFWPPSSRILPLVQENLYPNIILSYIAGSFPRMYARDLHVYGQNNEVDPGEVVEIFPSLTNFGLEASDPVQLRLIPRQSQLQMFNDEVYFSGLQTFDSLTAGTSWHFQVDYQTAVGSQLVFDIEISENGTVTNLDSLIIPIGTFEMAFGDDAENGFTQWLTGGSSAIWNITANSSQSPIHSFTDSPGGNYPNSANYWMRSLPIDLSSAITAELKFWTKWDIEADWDFALVEISTNGGSSWNHVIGQYMSSASSIGTQTTGLYGYDGQQNQWVEESIDLSAYCGQSILLRYRMTTDGSVTGDGWYVDDIRLRTLSQTTNIPPYIASATALNNQTYSGASYGVDAIILDDGGIDSVSLYYSADDGQSYLEIPMSGSDSLYHATIPPLTPGLDVKYYLTTWDSLGAFSHYPYNAPDNTLHLLISGSGPVLVIEPSSVQLTAAQLSSVIQPFKIFNPGTDPVSYSITDSTTQSFQNTPSSFEGRNLQNRIPKYLQSVLRKINLNSSQTANVPFIQGNALSDLLTVIITDSLGDTELPGVDILQVDFTETSFDYTISMTFAGLPDSNSIAVVSFDTDQNFGTGAYPAPLGYGLGNHDIGSEYDVVFDFANMIGDSLGLPPSGFVLNVQDSTPGLVGLPLPLSISTNTASLTLYKIFFPALFDNTMNVTATSLHLAGQAVPDLAPDFSHGNLGGELGCSWLTSFNPNGISGYPIIGIINPGDSVSMSLKVAAAYPLGIYQAVIKVSNTGPFSPLEMPVTMTIAPPGIAQINIDPLAITDTVEVGAGVLSRDLSISNNGTGTLYYTLTDTTFVGQNWLSVNPMLGAVQPGGMQVIDLQIDPTNLSVNNLYEAELRIFSNDPVHSELFIPIALFIASPNILTKSDPIPTELALYSNYPNPFNPSTTLRFDLPQASTVSLEIYNILGQKIATLADQKLAAGSHTYVWNGTNSLGEPISAGIYFYKLETPQRTLIKKMILTK